MCFLMNFSNGFKTQLCIYSEAITDPGLDVGALAIVDPAVPANTNMSNLSHIITQVSPSFKSVSVPDYLGAGAIVVQVGVQQTDSI